MDGFDCACVIIILLVIGLTVGLVYYSPDHSTDFGEDVIIDMEMRTGGFMNPDQCIIRTARGRIFDKSYDCGAFHINQTIRVYKDCDSCGIKFEGVSHNA